jgi:hypothetical protein
VDLFGSSPFITQPSYKSTELVTQHCIQISASVDLAQLSRFQEVAQ